MADNKNNILKKIVSKIGETASKVGSSMIDYATGGDYLGIGYDEKISAPTGLERKPSRLELNVRNYLETPHGPVASIRPARAIADDWGTRLY